MSLNDDDSLFIEILHPSKQSFSSVASGPSTSDAYVVTLQNPKECASFIKHLSSLLPLSSTLSHLKRVQRIRRDCHLETTSESAPQTLPTTDDPATAPLPFMSSENSNEFTSRQTKRQKLSATAAENGCGAPQSRDGMRSNTTTSTHPKIANVSTNKHESIQLKVLLGTKNEIDEQFGLCSQLMNHNITTQQSHTNDGSNQFQHDTGISKLFTSLQYPSTVQETMEIIPVPRGMPQSESEWKYCNDVWPTTYIPNQMEEHRLRQERMDQQLTPNELEQMKLGIQAATRDANQLQQQQQPLARYHHGGVVIVCPHTGKILATAHDEYVQQQQQQQSPTPTSCSGCDQNDGIPRRLQNPLMTPYIYAIQGISRIERQNMMRAPSDGDDTTFPLAVSDSPLSPPQYLCTGYDVYATIEPNIYEAMALLHSRIRRLVFGCSLTDAMVATYNNNNDHENAVDSGILDTFVHAIPSTNHHYRAFMCQPNSPLWQQCCHETKGHGNF